MRPAGGFVTFAAVLGTVLVAFGIWAAPLINAARSAESFARLVESRSADISELGIVAYKEQYLLQLRRPTFNFGHARWRDANQEATDAAAWLYASPTRGLLINEEARQWCFADSAAQEIAEANGEHWYLVRSVVRNQCVQRGASATVHRYDPSSGANAIPSTFGASQTSAVTAP